MFQPAMVVTPTISSPCFIGRIAITGSSKLISLRDRGRVGVEDLQAAHQQHEQGDDVHPMGDAHGARMAVDDLAFICLSYPRPPFAVSLIFRIQAKLRSVAAHGCAYP